MITLKSTNYTKADFQHLLDTISNGMVEVDCKDPYCPTCPVKQSCNDLHLLRRYLSKVVEETP